MLLNQPPLNQPPLDRSDRIVTYSPAYTLVPTYECFNRCSYCNFRVDPVQDEWMTEATALSKLEALQGSGVIEILILSGEVHPKSPKRSLWFDRIYRFAKLALDRGFLPHTNAGPLWRGEMEALGSVNVSLGLMLEQISSLVDSTVHRQAPSKAIETRLEQLHWAGELHIPFTTGLLLGIGETPTERITTLKTIAQVHQQWGHIQEVILQPYRPGEKQSGGKQSRDGNRDLPHHLSPDGLNFDLNQIPTIVAQAREILPPDITLQIPPNLVADGDLLLHCLEAGARDLGGLVPLDEVNPDYDHPSLPALSQHLAAAGWQLQPRLPLYPAFYSWSPIALCDKLPTDFPAKSTKG
jgi:FO synthase subunit 1